MYNKKTVITGLILFILAAGFPLWKNLASGEKTQKQPVIAATAGESCVENRDYMRASHMVLLHTWRDEVVRENKPVYINSKGHKFQKSLSKTCLNCHSNKEEFCDTCHESAGVSTYCFNCHLQPSQMEKGFHFQNNAKSGVAGEVR